MDALMQPLIIDKVFGFLSIFDVDQCQYVCRVWRKAALSILKKCPPIDECRAAWAHTLWEKVTDDEDAERQWLEFMTENHRMNMEGFSENELGYHLYYWYLWRGPFSDLLPMPKVDQTIRGFLTNEARCIPCFSFLQNKEYESNIMSGITFNHPTVIAKIRRNDVIDTFLINEIDSKIQRFEIGYKEKFPKLLPDPHSSQYSLYFEGFHINRYIPGVKIIITDWSDCGSARPDMNDPEFPIKSILCIATSINEYAAEIEEIEKLLRKSLVKPIFSGGTLRAFHGSIEDYPDEELVYNEQNDKPLRGEIKSMISYVDHKTKEPKESSIITIAFAGEEVKSAVHDILFKSNVEEDLEEFKRTLDFPTDDGRAVGFILDRWDPDTCGCCPMSDSSEICLKIRALFPSIKILRIAFNRLLNTSSKVLVTLYLIRV